MVNISTINLLIMKAKNKHKWHCFSSTNYSACCGFVCARQLFALIISEENQCLNYGRTSLRHILILRATSKHLVPFDNLNFSAKILKLEACYTYLSVFIENSKCVGTFYARQLSSRPLSVCLSVSHTLQPYQNEIFTVGCHKNVVFFVTKFRDAGW